MVLRACRLCDAEVLYVQMDNVRLVNVNIIEDYQASTHAKDMLTTHFTDGQTNKRAKSS